MSGTGARRVVLDCDPGHDDAMAILLAAASPALELVAITTVAGNQTLEKVTLNARRVCSVAGITSVPIAAGCDRPLSRPQVVAGDIHGASGLDGVDWDDPTVELDPRNGVDVIIEAAETGPLTLIAVGPLTNVATALERAPHIASNLERISIMGGAIGLGNRTPSAEFNIYVDPEAAAAVFAAGVPITLVPLEVTHLALATDEVLARIERLGTPVAAMSVALMRFFAETYERVFGFDAPAVHDPVAVAAVIQPSLVETRHVNVAIDTSSGISAGRTACDIHGVLGAAPNADVALRLDAPAFWDLMIEALATY
ncbi:MAG TPA: nucleoside hydrolase [Candidatus Limnocylindria bacterium]|nr:nucleoside hydrolase [Candidatus Limnocylindria bacterium]